MREFLVLYKSRIIRVLVLLVVLLLVAAYINGKNIVQETKNAIDVNESRA